MARLILCVLLMLASMAFTAQAAPQTRAEAIAINDAFLAGLGALNANRSDIAIPIFRRILARHPDLIRVRLELGRAYFEDRQWREARREFELALSANLPDAVRRNVLIFIRQIDARRGFDWQLDVALTRLGGERRFDSDTINLVFGGLTLPFTIERDDERQLGLTFDISARASTPIAALSGAQASTTAFAEPFAFGDYAETESLRDITYGLRGGVRVATAHTTASLAAVGWNRNLAASRFETRSGVEIAAEWRSARGLSVFGSGGWLDVVNHLNDNLDGHSTTLTLGVRQSLAGRASVGVSVFGEARRADGPFDGYNRYGASLFGSVEAGFGLALRGNVYAAHRTFLATNPIFSASPDEDEVGGSLRIEKIDLFVARRFTPYVAFSASRVESDIAALSYDESAVSVGVSKAF